MVKMSGKKPLEPLIPLEQFKKLVAAIARVPKDVATKPKPETKKPERRAT
jgi:hypothetical protein